VISINLDANPRNEESWEETRLDRDCVVRREVELEGSDVEDDEISRSRCSTPISSASSASMEVGTWVKVR
jgi:hypothetical protein